MQINSSRGRGGGHLSIVPSQFKCDQCERTESRIEYTTEISVNADLPRGWTEEREFGHGQRKHFCTWKCIVLFHGGTADVGSSPV